MSHKIAIAKILSNFQLSQEGIINSIDTLINDILNDIGTQFVGSTLESKEIDLKEALLVLAKHLRNDEKLFQEFEISISAAFEENFAVYCKANARKNQFNDEQINYISRNAAKHWLYQFSKNHGIKNNPFAGKKFFDYGQSISCGINYDGSSFTTIQNGNGPFTAKYPPIGVFDMVNADKAKSIIEDTYHLLVFLDDNHHIEIGDQIKLERIKKEWQSILAGELSAIPFKFFGEKQRQKMNPTDPTPQIVKEQSQMIEKQAEELKKQLDLITSQNQLADEQEKMIKELLEQISDLKETQIILTQRWDEKNKAISVENLKLWQCLDQTRVIKSYILENKNGIHSSNGFSLIKLTEMLTKFEQLDKLYREQDKKEASKDENKAIDKKLTCACEQIPPYFDFLDGYFASNTNYGTWHEASIHLPYKRLFEVREEADACYKKLLQERLLQSEVVTDVTAIDKLKFTSNVKVEEAFIKSLNDAGITPGLVQAFSSNNGLRVICYTANGVRHLSISHPDRQITWDELWHVRNNYGLATSQMAYVMPHNGMSNDNTITLIELFYK